MHTSVMITNREPGKG